ncbi:uncharacterized protein LOC111406809 [Olea europaea var. sylvestris]|uniref:uncharacterized protein LOC111406809 n=1 Tax=Olea europaea var. sylvestris TaxID=158386 RepID=UPI000C1CEDE3|nr:uncharacterized protein LOC111406809 [Olea europaea var. sylvestris]
MVAYMASLSKEKGLDKVIYYLHPYLCFVLNIFSRMLKGDIENIDFNYHPKCGPLKITHSAFADDLMLFARGDFISVRILMNCLSKFGNVSGLRINASKSSLYTAGIHGKQMEDIIAMTNIPRGSMPFHYLCISLAGKRLKISSYEVLLDKISMYICAWTRSTLSYMGRVELGIKKLLIAWSTICLPKVEGGLGFRDIRGRDILECTTRKNDSPLLKKMFEMRDTIAGNDRNGQIAGNLMTNWNNAVKFSVQAGCHFFRPKGEVRCWTREVWRPFITPKHAFILWLGVQLKLLTKDRLPYLNIDKNCAFCGSHFENGQYLFFQCSFTSSIWMRIKDWMGIRRSMTTIPNETPETCQAYYRRTMNPNHQ